MQAQMWAEIAKAIAKGVGDVTAGWMNEEAQRISTKEQISRINLSMDSRIGQRAMLANQQSAVAEVRAAAGGTEGAPSVMKAIAKDAAHDINVIKAQSLEGIRAAKYQLDLAKHARKVGVFGALTGVGQSAAFGAFSQGQTGAQQNLGQLGGAGG